MDNLTFFIMRTKRWALIGNVSAELIKNDGLRKSRITKISLMSEHWVSRVCNTLLHTNVEVASISVTLAIITFCKM